MWVDYLGGGAGQRVAAPPPSQIIGGPALPWPPSSYAYVLLSTVTWSIIERPFSNVRHSGLIVGCKWLALNEILIDSPSWI